MTGMPNSRSMSVLYFESVFEVRLQGHRQLSEVRWGGLLETARSETSGSSSDLNPSPKRVCAGPVMFSGVSVCGAAKEVGNLIVNREEALRLAG